MTSEHRPAAQSEIAEQGADVRQQTLRGGRIVRDLQQMLRCAGALEFAILMTASADLQDWIAFDRLPDQVVQRVAAE